MKALLGIWIFLTTLPFVPFVGLLVIDQLMRSDGWEGGRDINWLSLDVFAIAVGVIAAPFALLGVEPTISLIISIVWWAVGLLLIILTGFNAVKRY